MNFVIVGNLYIVFKMHLGDDSILLRWQRRYMVMVNPNGQFFFQDRGLVHCLRICQFWDRNHKSIVERFRFHSFSYEI